MQNSPHWPRLRYGFTLVEMILAVIILGILAVVATVHVDGSDATRAQALYSVSERIANNWMLASAHCGTTTDVATSQLPAQPGMNIALLMMNGSTAVNSGYAPCYRTSAIAPMSDVLSHGSGGQVTFDEHPLTVSGGGSAPLAVTFDGIPEDVAADVIINHAAARPALPLAPQDQTDPHVHWQLQQDGNFRVTLLFNPVITAAAGTPSPWPTVAAGQPTTVAPVKVAAISLPAAQTVVPPAMVQQVKIPAVNPPPVSGCSSNCGGSSTPPTGCTGNNCGPSTPPSSTPPPASGGCGNSSPSGYTTGDTSSQSASSPYGSSSGTSWWGTTPSGTGSATTTANSGPGGVSATGNSSANVTNGTASSGTCVTAQTPNGSGTSSTYGSATGSGQNTVTGSSSVTVDPNGNVSSTATSQSSSIGGGNVSAQASANASSTASSY